MPVLHIQLLGGFRLLVDAEPVTAVDTRRQQALIAYLLLHRATPQPRQRLAFLFWPESNDMQAQTNLRQLLYTLRQRLPDTERYLTINERTVQWRSNAPFTADLVVFEDALARADQGDRQERVATLERAVASYGGDLLPDAFDDWILTAREQLRLRFTQAAETLIDLHEAQRAYRPAIAHAQRLLSYDPLLEETYRRLMRLHALDGDRAAALRVYHSCATILERELGVAPSEPTQAAYARLLDAETLSISRDVREDVALTTRLIGRHAAWDALQRAWRVAAAGRAQCVLITGEGGIGKTRLAEEILAWTEQQGITHATTRCYAMEGSLPLAPVADWLRTPAFQPALARLAPAWRSELARLLPELRTETWNVEPEEGSERWQRARLFDALAAAILAARAPVLLVLDDLHWCDPETVAWLGFLMQRHPNARLLVVGTVRLEELDDLHPVRSLWLKLSSDAQLTELTLVPLTTEESAELAIETARQHLDRAILAQVVQASEGIPLYVVESLRGWQAIGDDAVALVAEQPSAQLDSLPPKIAAMIQTRLARLSPAAREFIELAAAIGRAFTFDMLAQVSDGDPDILVRSLDELWRRRIVREQRNGAYDFSHDRIREVAYAQISSARRRLLHRRIAQALEEMHRDELDGAAARIAAHYRQAGETAKAAAFYLRAAHKIQYGFAYAETMAHLQQGLLLLQDQPRTQENINLEIAMLLTRGRFISAHEGWGSTAAVATFTEAQRVCLATNNLTQLVRAQDYLQIAHADNGNLSSAHALAESNLKLATQLADPVEIEGAHGSLGLILLVMGEFMAAQHHLDQAATLAANMRRTHPLLYPGAYPNALVQWLLGSPEHALHYLQAVLEAQEPNVSPFDRMTGYEYCIMLFYWHGRRHEMHLYAQKLMALAEQHDFETYRWLARLYVTAASSALDQPQNASALCRESITLVMGKGIRMHVPFNLHLLANVHARAGEWTEAITALDEALAISAATSQHLWDAENYRQRGDLLLACGCADAAETDYTRAHAVAHAQQAKMLELRAAVSLGRLWQQQDKRAAAHRLVADIVQQFTVDVQAPDLRAAHELLAQVA